MVALMCCCHDSPDERENSCALDRIFTGERMACSHR